MKFLNLNDTYHHRKPAPTKFDCGLVPKSLLTLTHSALKAPSDKKSWHYLTSSVSLFQPLLKCPPLQMQLLGLALDLKTNRDGTDPNLPNTTRRKSYIWLVVHGSMYCSANTVLAWRAPNFKLDPGKTRSTRVTKVWMTSRLTRWIKH